MAKKNLKLSTAGEGRKKISNAVYEAELARLQDELVKLKEWVRRVIDFNLPSWSYSVRGWIS